MPTVQQIWDRGVDLADMTGSSFPDTDMMLPYVNSAVSDIHYMLADAVPDCEWHYATATIPVTANDGRYDLPDGTLYSSAPRFYKLLALWRVENDRRYLVPKYMRSEAHGYKPYPSVSATLLMEYVPAYVNLTAASDSIDDIYPPGWEDIAIMSVAAKLLHREESFDAEKSILALRNEKLGIMMRGVTPRDIGAPERVEDVSDRWRGMDSRWVSSPAFQYRIAGQELLIVEPAEMSSW